MARLLRSPQHGYRLIAVTNVFNGVCVIKKKNPLRLLAACSNIEIVTCRKLVGRELCYPELGSWHIYITRRLC